MFAPHGCRLPPRPGRRVFHDEPPRDDRTAENGLRATNLERTVVDITRFLDRYPAIAALDMFLRAGVRVDEIARHAASLPVAPGTRQLHDLLRHTDPRAQSPGESRTRLQIIDAGFPPPDSQIHVLHPTGSVSYLDLGYPDYGIGIEYDGREHHTHPDDRHHDRFRRERIEGLDWKLLVIGAETIRHPGPYLDTLLMLLLRHGWNPAPARLAEVRHRIRRLAAQANQSARRRPS